MTIVLSILAGIGITLIVICWLLSEVDDRPGLVYTPPPPTRMLELYGMDHPRHPDYYHDAEVLESTLAKQRGEMEDITPDRVARIAARIEAAKAQPLTLEISRS